MENGPAQMEEVMTKNTTEALLRQEIHCLKGYIAERQFPAMHSHNFTAVKITGNATEDFQHVLVSGVDCHDRLMEEQRG